VVLQVLSSHIGLNGLGNVLTGSAMITVGLIKLDLDWSLGRTAIAVVLLASALAVRLGIMLACSSVTFWIDGPGSMFGFAVHQIGDLARYPLAIYPGVLKGVLGVVFPFAFVSYFPISWLTGEGGLGWLGLLTPLVAVYCVTVSLLIFRRGLLRYESAGN
jgi:ABC-2 type transport system permease protein